MGVHRLALAWCGFFMWTCERIFGTFLPPGRNHPKIFSFVTRTHIHASFSPHGNVNIITAYLHTKWMLSQPFSLQFLFFVLFSIFITFTDPDVMLKDVNNGPAWAYISEKRSWWWILILGSKDKYRRLIRPLTGLHHHPALWLYQKPYSLDPNYLSRESVREREWPIHRSRWKGDLSHVEELIIIVLLFFGIFLLFFLFLNFLCNN